MDLDCLRYFAAAAREEHFGKAAQALAISQPSLSRGIARLEDFYGVALFQRDGRGVRLTRSGRALQHRVERVIAEIEDARRELADLTHDRRNRPIAFGFVATLGLRVVPHAISEFRGAHPDATFRLLQAPTPTLEQQLLGGEIDFCISPAKFADPTLEWLPLWDEELVLLVPTTHPAAAQGEADLISFANEPFAVLKRTYGLRRTVETLCSVAGFEPQISVESDAVATLHGLVVAGFGVALVPKLYGPEDPAVTGLHISNPRCSCTFGLSWARGRYVAPGTVEFRDFLVSLLQQKERHAEVAAT